MKTEEMQKQIESMMPTPEQIVEHLDYKLEEAKRLYATADANHRYILEYLFPQLKESEESEDERIRKELLQYVDLSLLTIDERRGRWIAWLLKQVSPDMVADAYLQGCNDTEKKLLEKQGEQKEYTFKSLPRLLDMIEPTNRAKAYCQKLIDTLVEEGYSTDAKIVGECLKQMNGEDVPMAVMDENKDEQKTPNMDKIKEKAHQIAWKSSKNYDPTLSKESWCEIAALEMAYWLEKQKD